MLHLPALSPTRFEAVQTSLPGAKGWLRVHGQSYLHADLALQRPTGKYVSRLLLRVLNVVLAGVKIRTLGHNAMPGLLFPELDSEKGIAQVPIWPKGYKVLVANVLGRKDVKGAIVVPAEPFMVLPVRPEWQNFEDYLGAMSTKYRTRAKKALKLAEGCEHVDLSDAPAHSWAAWASYLLKQTLRDKTVTLARLLGGAADDLQRELRRSVSRLWLPKGRPLGGLHYRHRGRRSRFMRCTWDLSPIMPSNRSFTSAA